jgi:hypothetical protein
MIVYAVLITHFKNQIINISSFVAAIPVCLARTATVLEM